jgi:hypothetical protein
MGFRAVLDAVVKRKIPSSCRESNPRTLIVQPVAQRMLNRFVGNMNTMNKKQRSTVRG